MNEAERLKNARNILLKLHKSMLDLERDMYEGIHGKLNAGEFLNLLLEDEDFSWLRKFSMLIVEIDADDEPVRPIKPETGAYTSTNVNLSVAKVDRKLVVDSFSHFPSSLSCDEQSFSSGAGVEKDLKIKNGKFKYNGDAAYVPEDFELKLKGKFIKDDGVKGSLQIVADNGSCESDPFKFTAYLIPTT